MTGSYIVDDRETPRFRVHRSTMTDPELVPGERARIFDTSWLYVAHESEIPHPFDFVTRDVGGRPIIVLRQADRTIRVLLNACSHRGMQIEMQSAGNRRNFDCFYHGWTYDSDGHLISLPESDSYGPNFDRGRLRLPQPAKVESYRGFIFLTWNTQSTDLVTFLAGATDYIDLLADQSEIGMEVAKGAHIYPARANWKLLVENGIDGYHARNTYRRYLKMVQDSGVDLASVFTSEGPPPRGYDLGNGHAVIAATDRSKGMHLGLGRAFPSDETRALHQRRRDLIAERLGAGETDRMFAPRNLLIFPNLLIIDLVMGATIRTVFPTAADETEITTWQLRPIDEAEELRSLRSGNFAAFFGPAGLATPDDLEALERCQRGFAISEIAPWNDISRGMSSAAPGFTDELQMRVFWRRWNELMTGEAALPEGALYAGNRGRANDVN